MIGIKRTVGILDFERVQCPIVGKRNAGIDIGPSVYIYFYIMENKVAAIVIVGIRPFRLFFLHEEKIRLPSRPDRKELNMPYSISRHGRVTSRADANFSAFVFMVPGVPNAGRYGMAKNGIAVM